MALKGKQFLDQVSKKKAVVICLVACLAGRKINGSSTACGRGIYCPGCGSKTDRRPVAAGVSPVGLSPDYHFNSERLDTLMAGGAIQQSTVIQLQNAEEELGLRPELTASIARTAVTRLV